MNWTTRRWKRFAFELCNEGVATGAPSDVLAILHEIATTLLPDPGLNERYLHHAFSHRLQTAAPCLDLAQPHRTLLLHPEWPTFKDATRIAYAKYRDTTFPDGKDCYMPVHRLIRRPQDWRRVLTQNRLG